MTQDTNPLTSEMPTGASRLIEWPSGQPASIPSQLGDLESRIRIAISQLELVESYLGYWLSGSRDAARDEIEQEAVAAEMDRVPSAVLRSMQDAWDLTLNILYTLTGE